MDKGVWVGRGRAADLLEYPHMLERYMGMHKMEAGGGEEMTVVWKFSFTLEHLLRGKPAIENFTFIRGTCP